MENKQIVDVIDGVDVAKCRNFISEWDFNSCGHICKGTECKYKRLWYKKQLDQLKRKEQGCELLKEDEKYLLNVIDHLQKQKNEWEEKYNDLGQDFDQLKAENEELRRSITKIFACLIKANRTNKIVDTIWVDNITTLWDYIALTLGIEGDQTQVEEQILQKISEVVDD